VRERQAVQASKQAANQPKFSCVVGWLVLWLVDWLVGWFFGWLIGWFARPTFFLHS